MIDIGVALVFAFVIGYLLAGGQNKSEARDAARYRHLRSTWRYVWEKHCMEWPRFYMPRDYLDTPLNEQLDRAIDDEIRIRILR